ncbi:exosortase C-terminal domain/associated protein EpsI [Kordiimonas sp. SCSIO 12610]|uniref:exosortase C-terminal domain/associated protein EpsI n=1 Tax=Kordiimonas sp. SCSIO 12610 TaxID=2829597 RepID=UPI00210B5DF2|nr:exosortase C-terminal domain/associated protein EpsI [Kordiimonas sp. SCSIO 12610]UTW55861.1 EpsI family protein [Kordiimonas sp. SCSIO 12610]
MIKRPPLQIVVIVCFLLFAGVLGQYLKPTEFSTVVAADFVLEDIVPTEFGEWYEDQYIKAVQPLEQSTLADKIYNQSISRSYRNANGDLIMLVIAYGRHQSDNLQLHLPETCYAANGFKVGNPVVAKIPLEQGGAGLLPAKRLFTSNGPRREPVTYWTRVGDDIPVSQRERQIGKLLYGLSGKIPDGILIRVSSFGDLNDQSFELHDTFIQDLLAIVPEDTLPLFLGNLSSKQEIL